MTIHKKATLMLLGSMLLASGSMLPMSEAASAETVGKVDKNQTEIQALIQQNQLLMRQNQQIMARLEKLEKQGAVGQAQTNSVQQSATEARLAQLEQKQEVQQKKYDWLPKFEGIFKNRYDYKRSSGTNNGKGSSANSLYEDMRLKLGGKAGDWDYKLAWLIIGTVQSGGEDRGGQFKTKKNLDYRDSMSPDMQLYMAQLVNNKVLGGRLAIGKFWNGVISDLEPTVYTDAFRGIGYAHSLGKFRLSGSYGVIDFNPATKAIVDDSKTPVGQRYTLSYKDKKLFAGIGLWHFKDLYTPQSYYPTYSTSTVIMSKLREYQLRYSFSKNITAAYFQGHSDASQEENFRIFQLRYKKMDMKKVGSFGVNIDYHYVGKNSVLDPGIVEMYANDNRQGLKGFGMQFNYIPMKNTMFLLEINPWNKAIADSEVSCTTLRSTFGVFF